MEKTCYNHPEKIAIRACHYCGRDLCSDCLKKRRKYYSCKNEDDCLMYQEKTIEPREKPNILSQKTVKEYDSEESDADLKKRKITEWFISTAALPFLFLFLSIFLAIFPGTFILRKIIIMLFFITIFLFLFCFGIWSIYSGYTIIPSKRKKEDMVVKRKYISKYMGVLSLLVAILLFYFVFIKLLQEAF